MFLDKLGFCAACPEMERTRNPEQPVFGGRSVFVQELLLKGGLPSKFKIIREPNLRFGRLWLLLSRLAKLQFAVRGLRRLCRFFQNQGQSGR